MDDSAARKIPIVEDAMQESDGGECDGKALGLVVPHQGW